MALWGFNRFVVILLAGAAVEMIPLVLWVVYNTLAEVTYPTTEVLHITGCVPNTQDQDTWPAYLCMIFAETGIVVLTLLKQYMNPVGEGASRSVLFETMYRDGLFFYAIVLSISVVNVLMMLLAPPELSPAMQMPLRVIHSALCTRVLLNLRKAASASPEATLNGTLSKHTTIAFHHSASERVDSDDDE
ncbi:hypothetical protein C8Q74DRAFT_1370958 [Fomes fomentarius]|nr:hypothetical protein C8Q74DRAFT_1370958 [Fomes fomentarius]